MTPSATSYGGSESTVRMKTDAPRQGEVACSNPVFRSIVPAQEKAMGSTARHHAAPRPPDRPAPTDWADLTQVTTTAGRDRTDGEAHPARKAGRSERTEGRRRGFGAWLR